LRVVAQATKREVEVVEVLATSERTRGSDNQLAAMQPFFGPSKPASAGKLGPKISRQRNYRLTNFHLYMVAF